MKHRIGEERANQKKEQEFDLVFPMAVKLHSPDHSHRLESNGYWVSLEAQSRITSGLPTIQELIRWCSQAWKGQYIGRQGHRQRRDTHWKVRGPKLHVR